MSLQERAGSAKNPLDNHEASVKLPPTIDRAIDLVLRTDSVTDAPKKLIAKGWSFPEELLAARVVARAAATGARKVGQWSGDAPPTGGVPPLATLKEAGTMAAPPFVRPRPQLLQGIDVSVLPDSVRQLVADHPEFLPRSRPAADALSPVHDPSLDDIWTEIQQALDDELLAVWKSKSTATLRLTAGQVQSTTNSGYVVVYEVERDVRLTEGQQVALRTGEKEFEAEVLAMAGARLQLWVRASSAPPPEGELLADASFLLRLRKDFCAQRATSKLSGETIHMVLAKSAGVVTVQDKWPGLDWMSGEQDHFIRIALGTPLSWLWGPPGTGKTSTLAVLLDELHRRGERILFVSNTNTAVDTALLRFARTAPSYGMGDVVRVGPAALAEVDRLPTPVTVEGIGASRGEAIATALQQCEAELESLRARNLAAIRKIDGRYDGEDDDSDTALHAIARRRDKYFEEDRATVPQVGYLVERRHLLREMLDRLEVAAYEQASVLFATVHQAYLRRLEGQRFDCVVIDEASMVSADLALIAAGLSDKRVVVAGDFRQLGPIHQSESPAAQKWLARSIFEHAGIPLEVSRHSTRPNLVALRQQHRMRPAVADLVSNAAYPENPLITSDLVMSRPAVAVALPDAGPVVVVDTSKLRPWMARASGIRSRYNPIHAQIAQVLVDALPEETSLGLNSPIAPQSALLRSVVGGDDEHRAASTVHRFQGGERDVILWDATLASGGRLSKVPWFSDSKTWEEGSRLVNVAISRAREQLLIIADVSSMRAGLGFDSTSMRVLRDAMKTGTLVDACDVIRSTATKAAEEHSHEDRSPLGWVLEGGAQMAMLWAPSLPDSVSPEILELLAQARRRGTHIYLRTVTPTTKAGHRAAHALQAVGVSVRYLDHSVESFALCGSRVASCGDPLLATDPAGPWVVSESRDMAAVLLRLVKRKHDPKMTAGEADSVLGCGHPQTLWYYRSTDGVPWLDTVCKYCG